MVIYKSSLINLLTLVLPAIGAIVPQLESRVPCGSQVNNGIIRRLWNPTLHDHILTWDGNEEITYIYQKGYQQDGDAITDGRLDEAGWFFETATPGTVPFYRLYCAATVTHLFTTDMTLVEQSLAADPPFVLEGNFASGIGISGYIYTDGTCPNTYPLYWAYSPTLTDNFYTVNVTAYELYLANGYEAKGAAAWVYPPNTATTSE